jgi:hypothetical protein
MARNSRASLKCSGAVTEWRFIASGKVVDMSLRLIVLFIFIYSLAGHINGYGFKLGGVSLPLYGSARSNTITQGFPGQSASGTTCTVTNIIIKSIDNYYVYAKDGRSFPIDNSVTIINNHNPDVKMQIGELLFKDGKLVTIIIK